uniref:Uncharacterized protein n=1 Tax=Oryza sativa subsp. japonica TaxID=39947 RepID=Q2R4M0_ORYSJ|nr:hypothetical protein LOC_Os11g28010 [Oryza sativa Japonica Group]
MAKAIGSDTRTSPDKDFIRRRCGYTVLKFQTIFVQKVPKIPKLAEVLSEIGSENLDNINFAVFAAEKYPFCHWPR